MGSDNTTFGRLNPKVTLGVVFGVSLAIANVSATKLAWFALPVIGGVAVPAGFVAIGVAFLCSDLMAEFYGEEYAHDVINATIVSLVVAYALLYAAIILPSAPFYGSQEAFASVLGSGSTIILASILTTLVSQHIDVSVFHRIRDATGAGRKWARNLGSTAVSQFVDTLLFIGLGFVILPALFGGDPQALGAAASIVVGQYIVKLVVALLDTPLFYAASAAISRGREVTA